VKNRISGVILAGGLARRFKGINKAKIIVDGITVFDRMTDVIAGIFDEIIIVTNNPEEFSSYPQYRITKDIFPGLGPVAGIHSGLLSCSGDAVFVFAGDMPFLDKKLITDMITYSETDKGDILVPRTGMNIEPLHAIYRKSIFKELEEFIVAGKSRAIRDFIFSRNYLSFRVEDTPGNRMAFTNINSPRDLNNLNPGM
jgi:molybdopterin-guanine dinucleotide biosynthesis protein A